MADARGFVTAYAYDNLYRRTQVTLPDPDGGAARHRRFGTIRTMQPTSSCRKPIP
jgi:hypothetical protein